MNEHKQLELYVDDDGYVCFKDFEGLEPPGIWWTLHWGGWEAYVDHPNEENPVYMKGGVEFPTDDELGEAAEAYEEEIKRRQNGTN